MTPSQSTWDTCCNIFKWISVGTADLQCGYSQVFPRECWEQQGRAAPRVRWQSDGLYPRCYNRLSGSRGRLLRRDLTNRNSGGPDSEWEGWWMDSVVQELLCKADSASLREGENVMRASCVHSLKTLEKRLMQGFSGNMLHHIDYYRAHTYSEELKKLSLALFWVSDSGEM